MRFSKAHIYGFGKWTDKIFTLQLNGITCIVGDNESGKSTFQAFITFILFGLPPKERSFYRPKTSGTLGGQLIVVSDKGEQFSIKRVDGQNNGAAVCIFENGKTRDEAWLKTQLKGMNAHLFASTFQFSTKDLYNFEQVEIKDIGNVLLSTSISGAPYLHHLEKQLERDMTTLFGPKATKRTINKQLEVLENIQRQLIDHAHVTEDYQKHTDKIAQAQKQMKDLHTQLTQMKKDHITWKQIETALPFIHQYEQAEILWNRAEIIDFPKNGMERLEEKQRVREQYRSNNAIIQQTINRYTEEMNAISLLPKSVTDEANALLQGKEDWSYLVRNQNELTKEKTVLHTELHTRLDPFRSAISIENVKEIELPPFIEKKWRELARDIEKIEDDHLENKKAIEKEKYKQQMIQEQLDKATKKLISSSHIAHVREKLEHDEQVRTNNSYVKTIQRETANTNKEIIKSYQKAFAYLVGAHGLAVVFIVGAFLYNIGLLYHGAILSAAFGWMWWLSARKEYTKINPENLKGQANTDTSLSEEEQRTLRERLDVHEQTAHMIVRLKQQREEAEQIHIQVQRQLEDLIEIEQSLNGQIEAHIYTYPFLDRIELSHWEDVGYVLREAHGIHRKLNDVTERMETNKKELQSFEQRVFTWWQAYQTDLDNVSVEFILTQLENVVIDGSKQQQAFDYAQRENKDAKENQKHVKQQISQEDEAINALFFQASVSSEEEFLARHQRHAEQVHIQAQMNEAKQQLIHIFTPSTWKKYIGKEIDTHTVQYEQRNQEDRIEELEKNIEHHRSILAASTAEVKQMERSGSQSYSERMHTFEIEKTLLAEQAKKWATLQVAQAFLEETKQTYMNKHLTDVVERAANHFIYITGEQYIAVHVNKENGIFTVEDMDHIQYNVQELSKGTRDQLYISLRLAMSEHMQQKMRFPFLFDDSFVHFDRLRTKRIIQLLATIAENEQVLIFTCKDEIEQMISTYVEQVSLSWIRIH